MIFFTWKFIALPQLNFQLSNVLIVNDFVMENVSGIFYEVLLQYFGLCYPINNLGTTSIEGNLRFFKFPLSNILFIRKVFIFKYAG